MENEQEVPRLELGKLGYEAYREHAGGVSLAHGGVLPQWSELEMKFVDAWNIAGAAIGLELVQEMTRISAKTGGKATIRMMGDFTGLLEAVDPQPEKPAPPVHKPSIGRIVIYHHPPDPTRGTEAHDCPAVVAMVYEDGSLDLFVMSPLDLDQHHSPVEYGNEVGQWSWPERV